MLDWLKNINKSYPEFYKNYLKKFHNKSDRFVALSLETTGLNPVKDVIMSFGAIGIVNDKIIVNDHFEIVIPQYQYLHDNGITNDFLQESSLPKMTEPNALEAFIDFLGNATLVGHRIHFDIEMINGILDKNGCGRLKNEALDVEVMYKKLNDINDRNFSLDELGSYFKITKFDRISPSDDAFSIALLFLKLKSKLHINLN